MAKRKLYNNIDIVITGNVAWCDELSWTEKILYGIIRGLTRNDYYCCYASNEHLGERIGRDESAVRRYLRSLEKLGFIKRTDAYVEDDYGGIYYTRAIVPTDMLKKFEKKRDEMKDLKGSQKNTPKAGKITRPQAGKNTHLNINMLPCKEKYINTTSNEDKDIPQPPYQGGDNAATLVKPEQYEVFGIFGNVRLTRSQRTAFSEEFGETKASALIEQLSAYIQSGVKRYRKKVDHYAILRDWALRRKERSETSTTRRSLVGDKDIARREYSDDDINAMFSSLDDDS